MKEKKNIDRIFQEKFKDFEANPDDEIWNSIASKLDEKKKKRPLVIPLWYKIGGVAAVIAVILASLIFTNTQGIDSNEPRVVFEKPGKNTNNQKATESEKSNRNEDQKDQTQNAITSETKESEINQADRSSTNNKASSKKLANENAKTDGNNTRRTKNVSADKKQKSDALAAQSSVSKKKNEKGELAINPEVIDKDPSGAIAENENSSKALDSLKQKKDTQTEEDALAELTKNENEAGEDETIPEAAKKKLRLSTFAAPVFYKNLGSGSELSSEFAKNSSSAEVTLSYGVKVAYSISDKVKLRTGISKINVSYNIQNISYSPAAIMNSFENIRPTEDNISIRSDINSDPAPILNGFTNNSIAPSIFTPGEINQQFGFIEVPLEIEYTLIDKKFVLNLIGGGSSLFLDKNRLDLVSGSTSTNIGEASNINNTSFSTNIGIGLDYDLTHNLSINLEPIFKYQLNTFNNVQNVQPANFGIYSGISIKF